MARSSWQEEFDQSIVAWQAGEPAAGRLACDRLMNHPDAPPEYRANARCNAVHYAMSLRDLPGYRDWAVAVPLPPGWFAFNPSIVEADGGFLLSARCANYAMPGWVIAPGDDRYRSLVAVVPLDGEGKPAGEPRLLQDATVGEDERDDRYAGPEDLRLIRLGDRLMASGSVARRLGPERRRTICMGLFDLDLEAGRIGNPRWLSGTPGSVEKNWMPVVPGDDGGLWFVYGCGPTIALECNPDAGLTGRSETAPAPLMAEGMRGGTQLLADGAGWLGLVHESADWAVGKRTYLHRVARFGADWRMTHLSHPFRFQGEEIEFAAGLARCGEDVLITFGTGDNACWVARLPEASLTGLLLPMETFGEAPAPPDYSVLPPDFRREGYQGLLDYLHREWNPDGYLEIGVERGQSLARARAASVGVDPSLRITADIVSGKPWVKLFGQTSDSFFAEWSRDQIFGDRQLELAFVDGLHLFEFALRDIMNAERWSSPEGLILVHDVIPNTLAAASRTFNQGDWEGDVWRVIPALRRWRPDLQIDVLGPEEVPHTGMLVITSLDPADEVLPANLDRIIAEGLDERIPYQEQFETFLRDVRFSSVNDVLRRLADRRTRGARFGVSPVRGAAAAGFAADPRSPVPPLVGAPPAPAGTAGPVYTALPGAAARADASRGVGELTLVSVLIRLESSWVDHERRLALLDPLFAAGIPMVLYADSYYRERIDPARTPDWVTIRPFELEGTATWRTIAAAGSLELPSLRWPEKDTAEYMALQLAKTEIVRRAVDDGFVSTPYTGFIDASIAKQFKEVTASFARLASAELGGLDRVLVPGCNPIRALPIEQLTDQVCWVMCGSMFILPTSMAREYEHLVLECLAEFLRRGRLVWEVNVWALLAGRRPELFLWYLADHDDRMTMIPRINGAAG